MVDLKYVDIKERKDRVIMWLRPLYLPRMNHAGSTKIMVRPLYVLSSSTI